MLLLLLLFSPFLLCKSFTRFICPHSGLRQVPNSAFAHPSPPSKPPTFHRRFSRRFPVGRKSACCVLLASSSRLPSVGLKLLYLEVRSSVRRRPKKKQQLKQWFKQKLVSSYKISTKTVKLNVNKKMRSDQVEIMPPVPNEANTLKKGRICNLLLLLHINICHGQSFMHLTSHHAYHTQFHSLINIQLYCTNSLYQWETRRLLA